MCSRSFGITRSIIARASFDLPACDSVLASCASMPSAAGLVRACGIVPEVRDVGLGIEYLDGERGIAEAIDDRASLTDQAIGRVDVAGDAVDAREPAIRQHAQRRMIDGLGRDHGTLERRA